MKPEAGVPAPSVPSRIRRFVRLIALNVLVLAALLVLAEGLASGFLLVMDLAALYVPPYRRHTNYDAELGWVDKPNVHIPDLYGRGLSFTTNSAGFRNKQEFSVHVPNGRYRVVCTGDSFTLGVGVDDDQTWCHVLTLLDPRIEAVNMGQPGYGVDQSYLFYKRAGAAIDHDAHLFALIGADVDRMLSAQFQGYDKPRLDVENGAVVVRNVPVPRRNYVFPWLTDRKAIFNTLRAAELARRLLHRSGAPPHELLAPAPPAALERPVGNTGELLRLLLLDLKRLNRERGSELFVLYLPALSDFEPGASDSWFETVRDAARAVDVRFVDVLGRFRALPRAEALGMFILPGQGTYPGVNHLNERGNVFVAQAIDEELRRR